MPLLFIRFVVVVVFFSLLFFWYFSAAVRRYEGRPALAQPLSFGQPAVGFGKDWGGVRRRVWPGVSGGGGCGHGSEAAKLLSQGEEGRRGWGGDYTLVFVGWGGILFFATYILTHFLYHRYSRSRSSSRSSTGALVVPEQWESEYDYYAVRGSIVVVLSCLVLSGVPV